MSQSKFSGGHGLVLYSRHLFGVFGRIAVRRARSCLFSHSEPSKSNKVSFKTALDRLPSSFFVFVTIILTLTALSPPLVAESYTITQLSRRSPTTVMMTMNLRLTAGKSPGPVVKSTFMTYQLVPLPKSAAGMVMSLK